MRNDSGNVHIGGTESASSKIPLIICGSVILLIVLAAIGAPLLAPHNPLSHHPEARFMPPGTPHFPLGTDNHGRDILSRMLFGARTTLTTAFMAVTIAALSGMLIGMTAAIAHRVIDAGFELLINTLLAFPLVILALVLLSAIGSGTFSLGITLGIGFTPLFARYFRLQTRALLQQNFVRSAIAIGARRPYILMIHIVPNLLPQIVIQMALNIVLIISVGTALSFLGFGAVPPTADWGLMLRDARSFLHRAPWMALLPGGALLITNVLLQTFAELLARQLYQR